jgi:hypothetical protein
MSLGALNPDRLASLIERYQQLESFGFSPEEKFLYGSHYSSPGLIMHFMIRQEPFTSMAIDLQSGKFDCPDRLFFDLKESWKSCNTSSSDVKELIPGKNFTFILVRRSDASRDRLLIFSSHHLLSPLVKNSLPCQKYSRTRTNFLLEPHKRGYMSTTSACPHGRKGRHMNLFEYTDLRLSLNMYQTICKTGLI